MKKFLLKTCSIVLLTITLVSLCLMGGCASKGVILKLEEAYEQGLISREELQQIADYNNRIEGSPYDVTEIKKSTQKGICKAYAKFLENENNWESVETEDDYIEITVDSLNPNKYVVSVVFGCETVKLYSTDAENLENTIKMFIY